MAEEKSFREAEFIQAVRLIDSYVFRRAICGEQTRGYWQVFAGLAYRINPDQPLQALAVGLRTAARRVPLSSTTRPSATRSASERSTESASASTLLDRLENHGSKEPTDTSRYSIEHIMPQNENLAHEWRAMLGEKDWKEVQQRWLHRLGNLTFTGYNSTYSDRPFDEKKSITGGFNESSVRLNKYVREQSRWTEARDSSSEERSSPKERSRSGPACKWIRSSWQRAEYEDKRRRAERRDVSKVPMDRTARELFS
jgi:hypothetical protein